MKERRRAVPASNEYARDWLLRERKRASEWRYDIERIALIAIHKPLRPRAMGVDDNLDRPPSAPLYRLDESKTTPQQHR